MKRIIAAIALTLFAAGGVKASNYPFDYTYQNVQVVSKGPALVATVSSGIMSKLVIGYKRGGILGASNSIQAVVRVTAVEYYSGYSKTTERVIALPKEWHGTGFMTKDMSLYDFVPAGFAGSLSRVEVAFFSGPQWDSNYGANYVVERNELYGSAARFRSENNGGPDTDLYCWDFIVSQMRK
ncbi:MAG: hypothetical protein A2081_01205 [Elusimicrobia bacterium GWC2_61_19]|nr:MAG: hypothetical protein A2081_01205 [Elusimicrobia bacterium GWC2_61_19]HBB67415.1 hypothetical protein [Elusimicrobiota bacterium]